jgi:hypothetical protein
MSNTEGATGQPICVLFEEAIAWIAVRSFTSAVVIGPRRFEALPFPEPEEEAEQYGIAEGRRMLAQELLVDYGKKGKIRIYADGVLAEAKQAVEDVSLPIQLATDFLSNAEYKFDIDVGHTLYVPEDRGYYNLAVNYDDLIREFWGDAAPSITIREPTARPERGTVPLRRRGRRPRYPWPDFAAELVRRVLYGPPIKKQAALERHMAEYCATSWGAEPAPSEIREWVRPTFRIISGSSAAARAPNGIADGRSPENTEAVDE